MKIKNISYLLTLLAVVFVFLSIKPSLTQTKAAQPDTSITPTPSKATSNDETETIDKLKQIEILKEKIATKVAEIRDQEKGALLGKITAIDKDSITLAGKTKEEKFSYSEDTLVFDLTGKSKKDAKISDLVKGSVISCFGYYNETKDTLLAKFIYIQNEPVRLTGKIADVQKSNYTLTVKSKEGDEVIDIEKYTTTTSYLKGGKPQKAGFSKFKVGDSVYIAATPNEKEENRYSAQRIILLSAVETATPTASASATPKP